MIEAHYRANWPGEPALVTVGELTVFVSAPSAGSVAYATIGLSPELELFLLARTADHDRDALVELLAAVARGPRRALGDTIDFGRPWLPDSRCDHGLISLPYTEGPDFERAGTTRVLWLLPITWAECSYKRQSGLEALESLFESSGFDYVDPLRDSVV